MEFESSGLSRQEIRKKRRKKERMQAMILLGIVFLILLLIIGGLAIVLVRFFSGTKQETKSTQVDAVSTESVVSQPEESTAQETDAEDLVEEITEEQEVEVPESSELSEQEESSEMSAEETAAAFEEFITQKIMSMTLEQKVAGLFFVTPEQLVGNESNITSVGSEFGNLIMEYPVGGIVLDESNMSPDDDLWSLVSNIQMYTSEDIFVGVEHEGGENSPFIKGNITQDVISSYHEIGESLGVSGAYSAGISTGGLLKDYDMNVNFAPNVDVSLKSGSAAEKEGFGVDAEMTAELGRNYVKGLTDQGIFAVVKHFPSYGDVMQDGSSGQVISKRTKEDLAKEYVPYTDAIDAGAKFVMVSHVSLPQVRGDNRPASLSKEVITDIIRTEWEYDGIVITDFMNKSCMYQKYTYAEAAVGAIEAGADMILAPKNFMKSYNGILDAVKEGTLTEERIDESLRRIYRVKLASQVSQLTQGVN